MLVAFAAAVLVVLVYWAEPPEEAWRSARWRLAVAALVAITMFSLWLAVGLGTQQRSTSYLVQNAHRPLVAIYLCLYVGALLVALGEIARLCLKYASSAGRAWLRRGLRTAAIGALIYSVNFWSRASAIVAVQLGLDPLEWEIVIVLGLGIGMALLIAGLTMPSWGPHLSDLRLWWRNYSAYRSLQPLWHDLHRVTMAIALPPRTRSIADANYRLYRRVIEIRDGLLALRSYRDPEVGRRALQGGRAAGLTGDELRAAVAAAELKAALQAKGAGRGVGPDRRSGADDTESFERCLGKDLTSEAAWLAQIARAYTRERG